MIKTDYDVVIVGGSANGAQAARVLARNGVSTLVVEKHKSIGIPEHCSGLFSITGLQEIQSLPPKQIVQNNGIYGARLFSPDGTSLVVRKPHRHAIVVDRAKFDKYLIEDAIKHGATVWNQTTAITAKRLSADTWNILLEQKGEKTWVSTKIIISAEGIRGSFVKTIGFRSYPKNAIVHAAQYYANNIEGIDKELVEVYQIQHYAKGYFAWVIPMSDSSAKIGLATTMRKAGKQLQKFISEHPFMKKRVNPSDVYYKTAGRIPMHGPFQKTYGDGIMLVGDIAGQNKPTTGGGVIIGGIGARLAAKIAIKALQREDWSASFLKHYERLWKKRLAMNLKAMKLVRLYLNALSDHDVNHLFRILTRQEIKTEIEEFGDVDEQKEIVKRLLFKPVLFPFYLKTFPLALKSLFKAFF